MILKSLFLFWQKIHHWILPEDPQITDNRADNLSGFSYSSFDENPSMNSGKDLNYDQVQSQPFVYVFDEITKAYCCCTCSYRSPVKQRITLHLMTHSGEKPFKCQFCEYSCAHKGNLDIHLRRTHSGVKPFKCQFCESSFTQKGHLSIHLRSHTWVEWKN